MRAITNAVTDLVATVASNLELLAYHEVLLLARFLGVTELATFMTHRYTAINDEAGFLEVLQVLLRTSGPADTTDLVTRLGRPTEGKDVGLINDASKRGDGHVVGYALSLLLGDEMHVHIALTEATLEVGGVDWSLTLHGLAVREEVDLEVIHVLVVVGGLHSGPGVFSRDCRSIGWPDVGTGSGTFSSTMAFLIAQAADSRRLGRALGGAVAFLIAGTASTSEGAINLGIRTIGLVVTWRTSVSSHHLIKALIEERPTHPHRN